MSASVTVRVPATSANLGPGFDCLGLALAWYEEITVAAAPGPAPAPFERLILDAAKTAFRAAGAEPPPELTASASAGIPRARGLGASAAARAAGIVAVNAMMEGKLDDDQMLNLGAGLEGHADNMAPALFGGLRVVVRDGERYRHAAAPVAPGLKVVLFVPDFEMPTAESRKLLPQSLSRADAVHNAARTALLVAALGAGRWNLLDAATDDRLHQPARSAMFKALPDIIAAARRAGAHGAYLSGAGSTVAAFATADEESVGRAMEEAARGGGYTGQVVISSPGDAGAEVIAQGV
jgi:homoserine kinase